MEKLPSIKIRKLQQADLGNLKKLISGISNFKKSEKECALELINYAIHNKKQQDYIIYIAHCNKSVCGFIIYGQIDLTKGCYDLYWIAIHRKFRKIGIGGKLIMHMEMNIKKKKGRSIFIETSSKKNYSFTRKFYVSCGYYKEACIKSFYDRTDDKIIYRKNITN